MAAVQTSDQLALHRPNLSSNRFRTEPWGGLFCDFRTTEATYFHLFIVLFSREREREGGIYGCECDTRVSYRAWKREEIFNPIVRGNGQSGAPSAANRVDWRGEGLGFDTLRDGVEELVMARSGSWRGRGRA